MINNILSITAVFDTSTNDTVFQTSFDSNTDKSTLPETQNRPKCTSKQVQLTLQTCPS